MTTANPNPYRRSLLRREVSLDTRRKLVHAAGQLRSEGGYESTTVEEICSAAGVGRTTYYLYFESKEQRARTDACDCPWRGRRGRGGGRRRLARRAASTLRRRIARRMESVPKSLAALTMRHAVAGAT